MAIFRHFLSHSLSLSQSDAGSAGSIVTPLQAHPTCQVYWVCYKQSDAGSAGPFVTPLQAHPTSHTTAVVVAEFVLFKTIWFFKKKNKNWNLFQ